MTYLDQDVTLPKWKDPQVTHPKVIGRPCLLSHIVGASVWHSKSTIKGGALPNYYTHLHFPVLPHEARIFQGFSSSLLLEFLFWVLPFGILPLGFPLEFLGSSLVFTSLFWCFLLVLLLWFGTLLWSSYIGLGSFLKGLVLWILKREPSSKVLFCVLSIVTSLLKWPCSLVGLAFFPCVHFIGLVFSFGIALVIWNFTLKFISWFMIFP